MAKQNNTSNPTTTKDPKRLPEWLISMKNFIGMIFLTPVALIQRLFTRLAMGKEAAKQLDADAKASDEFENMTSQYKKEAKILQKDWNALIAQKMKDAEYAQNPFSIKSVEIYVPHDANDKKFAINVTCMNNVAYGNQTDFKLYVTRDGELVCSEVVTPEVIKQVKALWDITQIKSADEVLAAAETPPEDISYDNSDEIPVETHDKTATQDNSCPYNMTALAKVPLENTEYDFSYLFGRIKLQTSQMSLDDAIRAKIAMESIKAWDKEIASRGNGCVAMAYETIAEEILSKDEPKSNLYIIPSFTENGTYAPVVMTATYKMNKSGEITGDDTVHLHLYRLAVSGKEETPVLVGKMDLNIPFGSSGLLTQQMRAAAQQMIAAHSVMIDSQLDVVGKENAGKSQVLYYAHPEDKSAVSFEGHDGMIIAKYNPATAPSDKMLTSIAEHIKNTPIESGAETLTSALATWIDSPIIDGCCIVNVERENTLYPAVFSWKTNGGSEDLSIRLINSTIEQTIPRDQMVDRSDLSESISTLIERVVKDMRDKPDEVPQGYPNESRTNETIENEEIG